MYIKEIELNNFRIYKGVNKINLSTSKDKNIIVVSGKNGFGKTTFLMSLVWCLYGKNMQNVDDLDIPTKVRQPDRPYISVSKRDNIQT